MKTGSVINLPFESIKDDKVWIAVSDIHLRPDEEKKEKILLDLLSEYEDRLGGLILLGDIFDIWFGYKHGIFYQGIRFLAKLKEYSEKGIIILYLEGNHDFLLRGFFQDYIKANIYKGVEFQLFNKRIYASHGDEYYFDSLNYRLIRYLMSNRFLQFMVSLVPVDLTYWFFNKLSGFSSKITMKKKFEKDRFLKNIIKRNKNRFIDIILTGHNHTELDVTLKVNDREIRVLNPGGFKNRLFYIIFEKNGIEIKIHDILSHDTN